jgi:hypothetical protein
MKNVVYRAAAVTEYWDIRLTRVTPWITVWSLLPDSSLILKRDWNRSSTGRSGKTNEIVIEAKMRVGRRQKLFRQEIGWCEPNYAGVSVI